MSVVSAPSSSSYRHNQQQRFSRRSGFGAGPPPANSSNFNRLRQDQDRVGLLPHSRSFDKSAISRDERSYWDGNDNSTVISGCTSTCSYSNLVQQKLEREKQEQRISIKEEKSRHCCSSSLCRLNFAGFISFLSILGVPVIVGAPFVTPYFGYDWPGIQCDLNSQRFLLVIGICLVMLLVLSWKVHSKRPSARLPRIVLSRVAFTLSLIFVLIGFGLSFVSNDVLPKNPNYVDILLHALLLLITTFLIHSLWYFFEIRQPQIFVTVHIVRDPDGESHTFSIRESAVQEAVIEILSKYSSTFSTFNPYKFRAKKEGQGNFKLGLNPVTAGFKVYTIDEGPDNCESNNGVISVSNAKTLIQAAIRRGRRDRSEHFHQNFEYDRKVEKKKSELILAAEEAFAHVNAINSNNAKFKARQMDAEETSQIILAAIYRPLAKYLKLTHQHQNFQWHKFGENLRCCLQHGFTAETFLQPYFEQLTQYNDTVPDSSKWSLLSDSHPANTVVHGQHFILRCLDQDTNLNVRLICRIELNPTFNIVQERSRNANYSYHFTPPGQGSDSPC
uniref:Vang-like protein n=1 Tax=Panagrolaimus superbus TaxID=310955 RepID=A0A914Y2J7_9BILA